MDSPQSFPLFLADGQRFWIDTDARDGLIFHQGLDAIFDETLRFFGFSRREARGKACVVDHFARVYLACRGA